jgi:hypothetical protein
MLSWLCVYRPEVVSGLSENSSVATRYISCFEMGYAELGLSEARPKSGVGPRVRFSLKFVSAVCLGQLLHLSLSDVLAPFKSSVWQREVGDMSKVYCICWM